MNNFKYFGVMVDCSRGAVPNVTSLKHFFDIISEMGYNCVMLYTEDTYEIPSEPFFGYKRGRYSQDELRKLDIYAKSKGIELIPCIQTLAHLSAMFRWNCYKPIWDIDDIILIDDERTYELIDKMFSSLSSCISSRKIHIGMDEAHNVGLGKYLDSHGYSNRYELLLRHLERVCKIAQKYGYETLMWEDMFFRFMQNGDYRTSQNIDFPKEITDKIPANCSMVYWDYYAERAEVYKAMCKNSKKLSDKVWFAGGAWCWGGFTPHNKLSIRRNSLALPICKEEGIENVILTMWGDNGGECPPFSVLPALMHAAAYAEGLSETEMKAKFEKITGVPYDDAIMLDTANHIYGDNISVDSSNYSKHKLYNDPLNGIANENSDSSINGIDSSIFTEKAAVLRKAREKAGDELFLIFDTQIKLCEALNVKFDLNEKTRKAYNKKDKSALRALAETEYPIFIEKLEAFYEAFRAQWLKINKPFGLEIHETRLGGLMLRTKSCRRIILDYCNGIIDTIPELEEESLPHGRGYIGSWRETFTAGPI